MLLCGLRYSVSTCCYAVCGTDAQRMLLPEVELQAAYAPGSVVGLHVSVPPYALPTQCPVLRCACGTAYVLPTRCPVLKSRMLISPCAMSYASTDPRY
eukprot:1966811-Rhodomonas_salina.1